MAWAISDAVRPAGPFKIYEECRNEKQQNGVSVSNVMSKIVNKEDPRPRNVTTRTAREGLRACQRHIIRVEVTNGNN